MDTRTPPFRIVLPGSGGESFSSDQRAACGACRNSISESDGHLSLDNRIPKHAEFNHLAYARVNAPTAHARR